VARLREAAFLDDKDLKPLVQSIKVTKGSVLHHGMINVESGTLSAMQNRFFVIDIDNEWRPQLSYYKEYFPAAEFKPDRRPDVLGTFNLASFTFTPTKQSRSSNLRSWRIDVTKGRASKSKNDKLVLEFHSVQDCYEWQAAFRLCKMGLEAFSEQGGRASLSRPGPQHAAPTQNASLHAHADSVSDTRVLCGHSLALNIPTTW
jgi:hypothetical protein